MLYLVICPWYRTCFSNCTNDASAYRAAMVYFLIGSCKNAGKNRREWMEETLKGIKDNKDLSELLPLNLMDNRQLQNRPDSLKIGTNRA